MLLSFLNSDNNLTTSGIIAIVFFGLIVLAIIGLTIGFFIYKGHVKKIYNVERRLTRLLNYPIENKIKRLSNIAESNDDFQDQIDDVKIIYTSEIIRRLNALNENYQKALQTKKIWKLNKINRMAINSWGVALDKLDAEINVLSTVIDILINTELSLRDDLIDFMKEWNNVEDHFENQKDNSDDESKFINQETIDKFNDQKNKLLTKYDEAISEGDFSTAKEVYNKLNDLGKQFLKETNLYPTHIDYFTKEYPLDKEQLIDSNATNESVRKLKKLLDEQEANVKEALDKKSYSKVIDGVDKIYTLLSNYKHNRKLENAFELFIEDSGNDLDEFFNEVGNSLAVVKNENSEEYQNLSSDLKDQLDKPIDNIRKIVSKIRKETLKDKSDNDRLNGQRTYFEDNLIIANRGIELLKSIKTKDEKVEESYVTFLSEVLKAKSTLIAAKDLISNPNNGLNEDDALVDQKLINNYEEQIEKMDANDVKSFDDKYDSQVSKVSIVNKLKEINSKLNELYSSLQESYRYYNLAEAIKIMYTDIKQPEYAPIWDELMKLFYKGRYKEFVQEYIKESEIQR